MRAESAHAALLVVIIVGLGLAVFSAVESLDPWFQGACYVNKVISCGAVDSSGHTTTLHVQDYTIGIAGFLLLLVVDIPLYRTWRLDLLRALVGLSALGLAVGAYFAYVELAIIHALCPVCFSTYVADAAVLVLSFYLLRTSRSEEPDPDSKNPSSDSEPTSSS
ncbi:MAG: hypothetical protein L3K05_06180 [Thermoplasmata archaeon]|nr:hypothetical protein [Thermoplasmata archaeon]